MTIDNRAEIHNWGRQCSARMAACGAGAGAGGDADDWVARERFAQRGL